MSWLHYLLIGFLLSVIKTIEISTGLLYVVGTRSAGRNGPRSRLG